MRGLYLIMCLETEHGCSCKPGTNGADKIFYV